MIILNRKLNEIFITLEHELENTKATIELELNDIKIKLKKIEEKKSSPRY